MNRLNKKLNPLISVLVPVYNSKNFLDKCLKSIINQSYKNLEIICIDDCSIDNSFNILKKYKKIDNRIKIAKHNTNMGENKTRRRLIDNLKGEYFIFVDSDDYIKSNMIQKMYNQLINDNSDLVECNVNMIKNGERKTDFSLKRFGVFKSKIYINFYKAVLWNKLFKTDIVKKNKINFSINKCITCGFDKFFNFEYISVIKKVSVIPDKLYNYVIHDLSTLSTMKNHQILSDFYSLNECYNFLHKNSLFCAFYMSFFKLLNKFESKLLKDDVFLNKALKQLQILHLKIYSNYRFLYYAYNVYRFLKQILSIQSTLDGSKRIITIIGLKLKIQK